MYSVKSIEEYSTAKCEKRLSHLEVVEACDTEYDDMDEALNTIHDSITKFLDEVINSLDKHNLLIYKDIAEIGVEEGSKVDI